MKINLLSYLMPPPCSPLSPIPNPLSSARLYWRNPAGSEPAPRHHIPNTTNLRSSAFICGSFFADKLETKILIHKGTRMTRIKRIFTDNPICVNPRHPRYPCSILFSDEVLDNNKQLVIKQIHLILQTLHSLRWCL